MPVGFVKDKTDRREGATVVRKIRAALCCLSPMQSVARRRIETYGPQCVGPSREEPLDGTDELRGTKGFSQGQGGADLRPLRAQAGIFYGRQEDDRGVLELGIGPQPAADLESVHPGHHDIEEDQVRPRLLGRRDPGRSIGSGEDLEAMVRQSVAAQAEQEAVIIDTEDPGGSERIRLFLQRFHLNRAATRDAAECALPPVLDLARRLIRETVAAESGGQHHAIPFQKP
jgi:hypothetical protein